MNFIDKILPLAVGNRTEILAFGYAIIRILSAFGVVNTHVADQVGEIVRPLGAATLAAKIGRAA